MTLISELENFPTEIVASCACCGRVGSPDRRWASLLSLPSRYGVLKCRCGLRWLSPRPNAAAYEVLYSDRHYFASTDGTNYANFVAHRMSHFENRLESVAVAGDRLLDFGAATGEFVQLALSRGIRAVGIEFSADARLTARRQYGIELLPPDAAIPEMDVIHLNHVFEHMPDPVSTLQKLHGCLVPGGRLVIEVPQQFDNLADRLRRMHGQGGKQDNFDAFSLHHTYFYTPATLRSICEKAGFKSTYLRTIVSPQQGEMSGFRRALEKVFRLSNRFLLNGDAIEWRGVRI